MRILRSNGGLRNDFIESIFETESGAGILKEAWTRAIKLIIDDLQRDVKLKPRDFPKDFPVVIKCKLICYLFCTREVCYEDK